MKTPMTCALLGLACLSAGVPALAAPATDPVVASFERIMTEEIILSAPASPTTPNDDPLRQAINVFLWEMQPGTCALAGRDVASAAPGTGS
jgi:hypothetical protein